MEECGELTQICAKMVAYEGTDEHPDGKGSMQARLQEEIADVLAAAGFVMQKLQLDSAAIRTRAETKVGLFKTWDNG